MRLGAHSIIRLLISFFLVYIRSSQLLSSSDTLFHFLFASRLGERISASKRLESSLCEEQEYFKRMEHNETGCQAPPEAPKLCANNCGFFGSAATMNLCSKCHKDLILKQEQAKVAAVSIESAVNATPNDWAKKAAVTLDVQAGSADLPFISTEASSTPPPNSEEKVKQTPTRCNTCRKRVGLTGFTCRCGHLFCAVHRYSDKHDCQYDYQAAAQDAISKANPVIKAEKLDKI